MGELVLSHQELAATEILTTPETSAIVAYLEEVFPTPSLKPEGPPTMWELIWPEAPNPVE